MFPENVAGDEGIWFLPLLGVSRVQAVQLHLDARQWSCYSVATMDLKRTLSFHVPAGPFAAWQLVLGLVLGPISAGF